MQQAALYHMLTGASPMDLFLVAPDSPRWMGVPKPLIPLLRAATAARPEDRPDDAHSMMHQVKAAMEALGKESDNEQATLHTQPPVPTYEQTTEGPVRPTPQPTPNLNHPASTLREFGSANWMPNTPLDTNRHATLWRCRSHGARYRRAHGSGSVYVLDSWPLHPSRAVRSSTMPMRSRHLKLDRRWSGSAR